MATDSITANKYSTYSEPLSTLAPIELPSTVWSEAHAEVQALEHRYSRIIAPRTDFSRSLVSYQQNKTEPFLRWFKYKEAFSKALVQRFLKELQIKEPQILDPFAGMGTTLFTAKEAGIHSVGIELLPVSAELIQTLALLTSLQKPLHLRNQLCALKDARPWLEHKSVKPFPHLTITRGAFPEETERKISAFLTFISDETDVMLSRVLRFALLSILESVSYTRKDGQYLRWDSRAKRKGPVSHFRKPQIADFDSAIDRILQILIEDIESKYNSGSNGFHSKGVIDLYVGSSLDVMPVLPNDSISAVITSPPYCNRYDYTRTYALELAALGVSNLEVNTLRQSLLSATVENKAKDGLIGVPARSYYAISKTFLKNHSPLAAIIEYLDAKRVNGELNNPGIPRMVRNYFVELMSVIAMTRDKLRPGGWFVMVNDNVRYAGLDIPVDLILSDFAAQSGFTIRHLWYLPRGKGNSSQQMGRYGRSELRKSIYVWQRA